MVSKDDAAVALSHAAASYHEGGYPSTVGPEFEALAAAAVNWARASSGAAPVRAQSTGERSGLVVPFGKNKGMPVEETSDKDLRYLSDAMARSIDDMSKERWRDSNQKLKDACDAELRRRGK